MDNFLELKQTKRYYRKGRARGRAEDTGKNKFEQNMTPMLENEAATVNHITLCANLKL